jgi:hypothetical protein
MKPMPTIDLDHAMCVYLGGDLDDGGIQVGMRDERLAAVFGVDAPSVKVTLDEILDVAVKGAPRGFAPGNRSIHSWLADQLPSLSVTCRKKIEAHVLYNVLH